MADFADMNAVYAEFFAEPYPARSAVAVKTLPKGAFIFPFYPITTSSTIIRTKPMAKPMVLRLEC